ncbi:MAG: hypothetical protein ACUVTD_08270 [Nitrososphaerales archaeon]
MSWKAVKEFLKFEWRKITIFFLLLTLYLSLSYLVLLIIYASYSALRAGFVFELSGIVRRCYDAVARGNLTEITKEEISEAFAKISEESLKMQEVLSKGLSPFLGIINFLSFGIGDPRAWFIERNIILISLPLGWYLITCAITNVWDRLNKTRYPAYLGIAALALGMISAVTAFLGLGIPIFLGLLTVGLGYISYRKGCKLLGMLAIIFGAITVIATSMAIIAIFTLL